MKTNRVGPDGGWTKAHRHHYSVIAVAVDLHGERTGSGANNHSREELLRKLSWLSWRVEEGWEVSKPGSEFEGFECGVRTLARLALGEWSERDRRLFGY